MRLIDADELINKAETCIETTDGFIELIKNAPTVESKKITFDDMNKYCKSIRVIGTLQDDGSSILGYESEEKEIYCTECPYFIETIYTGEEWHGAYCKKDGHGTEPSMYAIKSLHNNCPLIKESED